MPNFRKRRELVKYAIILLLVGLVGCAAPKAENADTTTRSAKQVPSVPTGSALAAPSDVAAAPAEAQTTESGLAYRVHVAGSGTRHPAATD